MDDQDQAALTLALATLRATDRNIEALALEAIAQDPETDDLDRAVNASMQSDVKAGAFGMEFAAAVLVPVLIEAGKQFWSAYSSKLATDAGEELGSWTIQKFKTWFSNADIARQSDTKEKLSEKIRAVGTERGMSVEDIDAIVAAISTEKLSEALAGVK